VGHQLTHIQPHLNMFHMKIKKVEI